MAFEAEAGKFTAEWAAEPVESEETVPLEDGPRALLIYSIEAQDDTPPAQSVTVTDFSDVAPLPPSVLDASIDGAAKETGGTVLGKKQVCYLDLPAVDGRIRLPGNLVQFLRIVIVDGRVYGIGEVASQGSEPSVDYKRLLDTFDPL